MEGREDCHVYVYIMEEDWVNALGIVESRLILLFTFMACPSLLRTEREASKEGRKTR